MFHSCLHRSLVVPPSDWARVTTFSLEPLKLSLLPPLLVVRATTQSTSATTTLQLMIGGDRANANMIDGDGNDSIYVAGGSIISSTIYGAGGNDSLTWSGDLGSGNVISLGAGEDIFTGKANVLSTTPPWAWVLVTTLFTSRSPAVFKAAASILVKATTSSSLTSRIPSWYSPLWHNHLRWCWRGHVPEERICGWCSAQVKAQFLYEANTESTVSAYDYWCRRCVRYLRVPLRARRSFQGFVQWQQRYWHQRYGDLHQHLATTMTARAAHVAANIRW